MLNMPTQLPGTSERRSRTTSELVRSLISWLRSLFKSRQKQTKVVPFATEDGRNFQVEELGANPRQSPSDKRRKNLYDSNEKRFRRKYTQFEILAQGHFSTVRKAISRRTSTPVVIKYIKRSLTSDYCCVYDSKYDAYIPPEISILARLEHPNIVEIQEFSKTPSSFILVMPTHGAHAIDLRQFISRLIAIDEPFCSYAFRQIVSGIHHLHENNILHGDIKADNVIINERFHCKLIDFGSASYFTEHAFTEHFSGSLSYCAPEVIRNGRYRGIDAEMYALGVVLYLLNFQDYPIEKRPELTKDNDIAQGASEGLGNLIDRLLDANYLTRCKMPELLQNQWLNQSVNVDDYKWCKMILI